MPGPHGTESRPRSCGAIDQRSFAQNRELHKESGEADERRPGPELGGNRMTTTTNLPTSAKLRTAKAVYDVEKIRRDFPILARDVRGNKLVYLDNAATSQKPQVVLDTIARYYEQENANIHRGVHFLSELATSEHDRARKGVQ